MPALVALAAAAAGGLGAACALAAAPAGTGGGAAAAAPVPGGARAAPGCAEEAGRRQHGRRACGAALGGALLGGATQGGVLPLGQGVAPGAAWAYAETVEEKQTTAIFRAGTQGVVSVARSFRPGEPRRRGSAEDDGVPPVVGSGFVWDDEHIVTNFHVIKDLGPGNLSVIFLDPNTYSSDDPPQRQVVDGEVVGADPASDTAVLRILRSGTEPRMQKLPRSTSARLEVGQTVYAIGNPFGLEHSMSKGIIAGIARTLDIGERPIRGCIQTDATINPGNSGGPLLDSAGRVIGVNTAILTNTGLSAGVGLAIPIDLVTKNVDAIIKTGYVARAYLGITFAPDQVADTLQLPGIIVMTVVPGSPAEKAGIKPMRKGILGDVVVGVGGNPVRTGADLFRLLDKRSPGETVAFKVQRPVLFTEDGASSVQDMVLNVTLAGSPPRSVLQETILNITRDSNLR